MGIRKGKYYPLYFCVYSKYSVIKSNSKTPSHYVVTTELKGKDFCLWPQSFYRNAKMQVVPESSLAHPGWADGGQKPWRSRKRGKPCSTGGNTSFMPVGRCLQEAHPPNSPPSSPTDGLHECVLPVFTSNAVLGLL